MRNAAEPSTTLWERWDADTRAADQADSSRNHIMFGSVSSFLWKYVAGLSAAVPGWKQVNIAPSFGETCSASDTATVHMSIGLRGHNSYTRGSGNGISVDEGSGSEKKSPLAAVDATLLTAAGTFTVWWELLAASATARINATIPEGASAGDHTIVVPCVSPTAVVREGSAIVWQHNRFDPTASIRVVSAIRLASPSMSVSFRVQQSGAYHFERTGGT